jgi:tRNA(Ile)-lysidine synthase
MLNLLAKERSAIVVAHFNHGIRDDSDQDEKLVRDLAKQHGFRFESKKENLGVCASETRARQHRYKFLNEVAAKHDGVIHTAHHADDVIETIALNLIRGTGWRGLTPLDNPNMVRPLITWHKTEIYDYARKNNLKWHEDSTNLDSTHLRNRLRHSLQELLLQEGKKELLELYEKQKDLKRQIDAMVGEFLAVRDREVFRQLDDNVALEILRAICTVQDITPLRPNIELALQAIRTFKNGKKFELSKYVTIKITRNEFAVLTN